MLYLADTHIALWLIEDSERLPQKVRKLMQDPKNSWYISLVSVWEIALKHAKHPKAVPLTPEQFHRACIAAGLRDIPLNLEHVYRMDKLSTDGVHADPFDRMLLTQAKYEDLLFVTHDKAFAAYEDAHVLLV